jgi:hypothetical protein
MITANPIKHKRGDVREDGMVFWANGKAFIGGQYWVTKEKFDELKKKQYLAFKARCEKNPKPNNKYKLGHIREDGMIFWHCVANKELWLTEEKFKQYKQNAKKLDEKYNANNPEIRKSRQRKWYQKNRREKLVKQKQRRQSNLEFYREKDRNLKKKNKEKHRASSRAWKENNKERAKQNLSRWKENNKERFKILNRSGAAKYRARKRNACVNLSEAQEKIIKTIYDLRQRLEHRLEIKFHVDHIVPLAKGGLHIPSNLQVLPATLNLQKKDLKVFHWSEYQPA